MKTIEVQVADSKVEFFLEVLKHLDLEEDGRTESASIPEWHKAELDQALAEAENSDDDISAEEFIAQIRRERALKS